MMKPTLLLVLVGCLGLVTLVSAQRADPADLALKAAIQQELVNGDLSVAIDAYRGIVARYASNAPVVAAALVRLGRAYETLGSSDASAAYEQVLQRFPGQKEAAAEARTRLRVLAGGRQANAEPTIRMVLAGDDADSGAYITPDGGFLSRPDWDTGDLIIRDMSSGKATRMLAKNGSYDTSDDEVEAAMVSPDGKHIVYVWWTENRSGTATTSARNELRVMANAVGAESRVLIDRAEFTYFEPVGWSPDGAAIIVTLFKAGGSSQIARVSLMDRAVTPITQPDGFIRSRPSLSADGKYLVYSALTAAPPPPGGARATGLPDQHLYVAQTTGAGTETVLTKGPNVNESPVWTPDDRHIVFVSNRSGQFGLWSIGVENGRAASEAAPVRTNTTGRISPLGMTRSGTYHYIPEYGSGTGGRGHDVFVADMDPLTGKIAGPGTRVSDNAVDSNRAPAWSPDGHRVAFKRFRLNASGELVVHDVDTGREKSYNSPMDQNTPLIWFHDGKSLVVRFNRNVGRGGAGLNHIDLGTGRVEVLAHAFPPDHWQTAVLSPDDKTLYLTILDGQAPLARRLARVVAWDLTSGSQRDVWKSEGPLIGAFDRLALSPDGRTLATVLQREGWTTRRLVRFGVDGSDYRELASPIQGSMLSWTADSQAVLTAVGSSPKAPLVRISTSTGKQEPTGLAINRPGGHVIDVSPDGSRIVYSDSTRDDELWAIDNLPSLLKGGR